MMKLKEVKRELINKNLWKKYKKKFKHKQMQLVFSKIIINLNPLIIVKYLVEIEQIALKSSYCDEENMFEHVFKDFNKYTQVEADWEAFSKFMFYVYQTSTYWKDIKKEVKNVFSKDNCIEKNKIKRNYYYEWMNSLKIDNNLNTIVLKTMKEVF